MVKTDEEFLQRNGAVQTFRGGLYNVWQISDRYLRVNHRTGAVWVDDVPMPNLTEALKHIDMDTMKRKYG